MVKSPVLRSPGQILVNHWLSALSGAMRRLWFASSFRTSTERASSLGMEDCYLEIWSSRCVCVLDLMLRHCTVGVNHPGFDSTCCHGLHHLLFRGELCEDSAYSQIKSDLFIYFNFRGNLWISLLFNFEIIILMLWLLTNKWPTY